VQTYPDLLAGQVLLRQVRQVERQVQVAVDDRAEGCLVVIDAPQLKVFPMVMLVEQVEQVDSLVLGPLVYFGHLDIIVVLFAHLFVQVSEHSVPLFALAVHSPHLGQ
tara:strand:- start:1 stop:321 length:321 start_codon:yes stop_codon:yes gene_type:complete